MNKNTPLITVYITNFNYGNYIKEAIDSVLNQTCQDFELIIIDDGSTDDSRKIIEEYSNTLKVKIIYQQNKGLNVTNNVALKIAQGKFILRIDADDFIEKNMLELLSDELIKNDELGLVFPDYYNVDIEGNVVSEVQRFAFDKDVSLFDLPAHGACTMIRKSFLLQLGGYDEQYQCQDGYELWIKFITKHKVSNINIPLFYYRQHGNNLTGNEDKILNTRAAIKANYFEKIGFDIKKADAIIPIRGSKYDSKNIAFIKLNGKCIIDIKIDQALNSKYINEIIISSPDISIGEYISNNYSNNNKVKFHLRREELARINVDLSETLKDIIGSELFSNIIPEYLCILSIEFPFSSSIIIDDAINTIQLFKTDSLISVRSETNTFYHHDGNGMKAILRQDKYTRLEREAIYKHTGGVNIVRTSFFEQNREIISGTIGHLVIDQKSSFEIKTKLDIKIAEILAESLI
jgi:glycosyltransferase involved in cell wall biosynthesis